MIQATVHRILLAVTLFAISAVALAQAGQSVQTPPNTAITVTGDIPSAIRLDQAALEKLPQETVSVQEEDGSSARYTGVSLRALLEQVGAPMGKSLRGKALASYVLVKARDGYQVVFALPELDESFGNEKVLLVYKRDGKPLFGYQGPFRIVCPNDKAGARSIRMVDSIEVVRLRK
jgi:hypothetical protein